jgi:hypothetical protein
MEGAVVDYQFYPDNKNIFGDRKNAPSSCLNVGNFFFYPIH